MYSTILMIRTCHKIIHNYSWASHGTWSMQYCPMLQTITIANSELSFGTSLHLAMLSHEHCPICVHFNCHFGTHVSVQYCVGANTTVTRLLLTRCDDCRYISHCFINRTIVMTNVRLAWDKTKCPAFIVYHRVVFHSISSAHVPVA